MLFTVRTLNLGLRGLMELGIVIGLATWGYRTGTRLSDQVLLALATPLIGFGFWGLVDFRKAGRWAELLRLLQELTLSGLAAAAWYASASPVLGWTLGLLSILHHLLVYAAGDTLLPAPMARDRSRSEA